jgi:hypothetical protein
MRNCEHFQAQMLEHLYGLLDSNDSQALTDHLDNCPACRAAHAQAEVHQKLLATAAKTQFAGLRFQAPAAQPTTAPAPRAVSVSGRARWVPWAVAAGVLLALAGLGVPGAIYWNQENRAEQALARSRQVESEKQATEERYRTNLAQAEGAIRELESDIQKLQQEQQQAQAQAQQAAWAKEVRLAVTGPPALQPGAPNQFQVEAQNRQGQQVAVPFAVEVRDRDNRLIYEPKDLQPQGTGRASFTLPSDLPVKPDSELSLVVSTRGEAAAPAKVSEKLSLAAPLYLTHLTTDKPMYQPGEVVHFRSLTVERFSLKPVDEDLRLIYAVKNSKGEEVFHLDGLPRLIDEKARNLFLGPDGKPVRGVGAGDYRIDPEALGGEYSLAVSDAEGRFPPQTRKFIVNRYQKPRLNKELEFTRKSYGPGDAVTAACKAARAEGGGALANQPVTAFVNVDGRQYGADGKEGGALSSRTDANGAVSVKFTLPARIDKGEASLSVRFSDGASVETLSRPIPVVLKKLQVEFFPEGGDLVADLPNRVYFQARTTLDKPAEVKGRIVDAEGQVAAEAQTFNDPTQPGANQGMGQFTFTPRAGRKYQLKIDSPNGIEGQYLLPEVKADGVLLSIPQGVTTDKDPIRVVVRSAGKDRSVLVSACCRGRLMTHQRGKVQKGGAEEFDLKPEIGVGGVYRVTVFEEQGDGDRRQLVPRAERLVYRAPAGRLNLAVQPDKPRYVPGDNVNLSLQATDEKGQPSPAVLFVAVVDKSVVTLADEKTYRSLPTHFFLTTEVRRPEDLEHADFLLGNHASAATALDLLLGTQGWRRFAEQNPTLFRQQQKEDADRLLLAYGALTPQLSAKRTDLAAEQVLKVRKDFEARLQDKNESLIQARKGQEAAREDKDLLERSAALGTELATANHQAEAEAAQLTRYKETARTYGPLVLRVVAVLLLLVSGLTLIAGLRRGTTHRALPYFVTAACSILLFGFVATFQFGREDQPTVAQGLPVGKPPSTATRTAEPATAPAGAAGEVPRPAKAEEAPDVAKALPPLAPAHAAMQKPGMAPAAAPRLVEKELPKEAKDAPAAGDKAPPPMEKDKEEGQGKARFMNRFNAPQNLDRDGLAGREKGKKLDLGKDQLKRLEDRVERNGAADAKKAADDEGRLGLRQLRKQAAARVPMQIPGGGAMPGGAGPMAKRPAGGPGGGMGGIPAGGGMPGMPGGGAGMPGMPGPERIRRGMAGGAGGGKGAGVAKEVEALQELPPEPFIIREYAHERPRGESGVRRDFAETLYWHPVLVLPGDGKGQVSFPLCDSVTTFQVLAAGHTLDGRLGAVTAHLESRKPFTLEPKLPIEVTAGDRIDIPLAIANNTDQERQVKVRFEPSNLALVEGKAEDQLTLPANQRARRVYRFRPTIVEGEARLEAFGGENDLFGDRVQRTFKVVPEGFPVVGTQSDMLEKVARGEIVLPETWIKGTLKCSVAVYPSTLADLQKGLEALLREPGGCFEQTSTSNYPNLLILDYLKESDQAKPEVARHAQDLLARGYQMLTSFECLDPGKNQRQGYEWFGGTAPAHEALTAYGLLQFRDMARVYDVDKNMVERTKTYLMSRKDGRGGFTRNPRALDTFGRAPEHITNAYIVWALTESGKEDDVARELNALAEKAKTSNDPYFLALVANGLLNRDRADEGLALLKKLKEAQKDDGHLDAAETSITGSGGRDLQIETTALGVLAWIKGNRPVEFNAPLQKGIKWLGQQRGGYGGYGSTQSTILTLKALIAYAKANKKTAEAGDVVLKVGGFTASQHFNPGTEDAILLDLPDPQAHLKPGKNAVDVEITGKNVFPYTLMWTYNTQKPASAAQCAVALKSGLDRQTAEEGEMVRLTVAVENKSGKGQGMTVAIVGLPAGLTLPEDLKQLKDMARLRNNGTEQGPISAFEVRDRELVLYWRDMAPDKKVEVNLDLICRVPGEYRGPASRAYLYYNADHKCWVEPLKMSITAKAGD